MPANNKENIDWEGMENLFQVSRATSIVDLMNEINPQENGGKGMRLSLIGLVLICQSAQFDHDEKAREISMNILKEKLPVQWQLVVREGGQYLELDYDGSRKSMYIAPAPPEYRLGFNPTNK
jgi:hypothetical protein